MKGLINLPALYVFLFRVKPTAAFPRGMVVHPATNARAMYAPEAAMRSQMPAKGTPTRPGLVMEGENLA